MSKLSLDDCIEVTSTELFEISEEPRFEGQTSPKNDGVYWMIWEVKGTLYKTKNKL